MTAPASSYTGAIALVYDSRETDFADVARFKNRSIIGQRFGAFGIDRSIAGYSLDTKDQVRALGLLKGACFAKSEVSFLKSTLGLATGRKVGWL